MEVLHKIISQVRNKTCSIFQGDKKRFSLASVYLFLGLLFGTGMVVANPPFAGVPDEHAHYWKAWSIAEGYVRCTGSDHIPKTAQQLPDAIKPIKYEDIEDKKVVVAYLRHYLFQKETQEKSNIGGANCPSTPFGYLPQVIGFRIGSLVGLSALADVYLARFLNMLVATFLVYAAIRIMPFGKIILLLVGLLPLTIQQFASLSYDALQISFSLLFIAYVFYLAFGRHLKEISKKEIALLFLLSLFGLNIKLGYFPLMLLALLIPAKRFGSLRKYITFQIVFLVSNIGFFLMLRYFFQDIAMPTHTNPSEQLRFVLYAPLHFLNVVFETVYGSGLTKYVSGILYRPGWGASSPPLMSVALFLWILFLVRTQKENVTLSFKHRVIIASTFFINFLLLYLALYMGWSKVGAEKVSGVQGRYLISLLPLFILTFYSGLGKWSTPRIDRWRNAYIIMGFCAIFLFVFINIYRDYYLKVPSGKSVYERYLEEKDRE